MIEVSHLNEKERLTALPQEVQEIILGVLQILDTEYGADRDKYKDDGGYVAILEKEEDFQQIKDKAYIDCDDIIPEYVSLPTDVQWMAQKVKNMIINGNSLQDIDFIKDNRYHS